MTKHTPGPWEAKNFAGAGWTVRKQHERPGYTGHAPICSMAWFQFDIPGIIDDTISGANAQLCAAAPELLAALQRIQAWMNNWTDFHSRPDHHDIHRLIDDALAKAIGQ